MRHCRRQLQFISFSTLTKVGDKIRLYEAENLFETLRLITLCHPITCNLLIELEQQPQFSSKRLIRPQFKEVTLFNQ